MATKLVNGERVELSQQEIDARQAEQDNYVEPIPQSVTLLQAKLAVDESTLTFNGLDLDGSITAFIDALDPKPRKQARKRWNHSVIVRRNNSLVVQVLEGVGLTGQQIDDLFVLAATQD